MVELSDNAKKIFNDLYCKEGETIEECFRRVAKEYATNPEEEEFAYQIQIDNIFRGNTPIYFNSGSKHRIFSACFVSNLIDSMEGIYDVVNVARKIFQAGSGIGIPIGNLREKDAPIYERDEHTKTQSAVPVGKASGPISFMKLYDTVGATTKSGGRSRRAAIMAPMPVYHPDIKEFIHCKVDNNIFSNMNISVIVPDDFMQALYDGNTEYPTRTPFDNSRVGSINPTEVWEMISKAAWKCGDPGVIFIDEVNKNNVLKKHFTIETSNPCSEQYLIPFLACNLSMINLGKFYLEETNSFDFESLFNYSYKITILMDNLIDKMDFPDERFKTNVKKYRPIGIGFAGLADVYFLMGIRYGSKEGNELASKIMETITSGCLSSSADLAKEKGKFYNYDSVQDDVIDIISKHITDKQIIDKLAENGLRNIAVTTIAPTGTCAISCDATYGMEPCFGLVFEKNLISGEKMYFVNPIFETKFQDEPWYNEELFQKIWENKGSIKNLRRVPKEVRDVFVVAHDIKPKERIDVQAALQKHCSSGISSTINLPHTSTPEDIAEIYKYAYESGLKGITVYRDGCKKDQPITFKENKQPTISHRPATIRGNTTEIDFGEKKVLITHNSYGGELKEIIINLGKSGDQEYTLCEGLGRSMSIGLRAAIDKLEYVKQFKNIKSDQPVWIRFEEEDKKPVQVWSIPDAIAKIIERYYINGGKESDDGNAEICPKCDNRTLMMVEGCATCQSCGWSKCS